MPRQYRAVGQLVLIVTVIAACGVTMKPRVGVRGVGDSPAAPPGETLGPRPSPAAGGVADDRPYIDQICRTRPVPSGWIAVRYAMGSDRCPEPTDPENPYTVAIIERYDQKPVDATMVVCADQSVPRNWTRDWYAETDRTCPGARVAADAPTTFVIRRMR